MTKTAKLSVWRPLALTRMMLGVAHYPEQVDPSFLLRDARRMAETGINVVRMGEFAWHLWEPGEGSFAFDLFDAAIKTFGAHGIDTILCTPTATPPRWLTRDYPEVLRVDENGRPMQHGSRQHADTASPVFRHHSRRITRALTAHYRTNSHVIGWQTDNELNNTVSESYSASCRLAFQNWLRDRYDGSIAALNHAWGGHFWALAYDGFADVNLPRNGTPTFQGPGHMLDFHRFLADATADFQADQISIIRQANPDWFIYHDVGGTADLDLRGRFGQDLDFLGVNNYPMLYDEFDRPGGHGIAQGWRLDRLRAATGNFIIPEQACGMGSQPGFATLNPEPGEMRRMAFSSVARGADGVLFFRWRPAHAGAEIYWTGLLNHDDTPSRRLDEAQRLFGELAALAPDLLGTHVRMDIGIAGADFDAQEAHKTYAMDLPAPEDDAFHLYAECYRRQIACGVIHPEDDLSRLKVLYVPHWVIWKAAWTDAVTAFVEAGGVLILGAMTGTRNAANAVIETVAPGFGLSDLAGVEVREFGSLAAPGADGILAPAVPGFPGAYRPAAHVAAASAARRYRMKMGEREIEAGHLYEHLDLHDGTAPLAVWANGWLAGSAAVTVRQRGAGRVIYVASYLVPDLAAAIVDELCASASVAPILAGVPEGVEVTERRSDGRRLIFICNQTADARTLAATPKGHDLVRNLPLDGGALHLDPYACHVIVPSRGE